MSHDEIDRILSHEGELLPSSGFAASVMDAVRREAVAPPPIPFPWRRAIPGLAVAGLTLVSVVVVLVAGITQASGEGASPRGVEVWPSMLTSLMHAATTATAGWTFLALGLTLVSVMFSLRLASGRA